ncbi:hypothetical protein [Aestuariibaculum marinum]|uniref:PDZ domain-containing protein n=1 Tax=Aestuariibaculum marinum TaxID=2683592 RepID=A0A8J6UCI4_9FLAO|nr:hypothetical protein [Aestuariibaculum marinum]MBD0824953.1 hypothetical protein [Aestuariibaculum marinum]
MNPVTVLPLDFVVDDYLIGYINNVLVVKLNLATEQGTEASETDPLKLRDRIVTIDGVSAKDLNEALVSKIKQKETVKL